MSAIKTTLVGGVFFLLPFGVLLFVLEELVDFAMLFAQPIANLFPVDDIVGIAVVNVIAWVLILGGCYLAGLLAQTATVSRASSRIDGALSRVVPGYRFIVAKMEGLFGEGQFDRERATPVLVEMSGALRFGLEMSRDAASGNAIIYLPGAPNPESGIVVTVEADSLRPLSMSSADLIQMMMFYGRNPS